MGDDDVVRPECAQDCSSKRIDYVRLYKPKFAAGSSSSGSGSSKNKKKSSSIRMYHVMFLVLYVYQVVWVVRSIGQPYRLFLEKADREGFSVMEGSAKMRAQMEYSLSDINDPDRRTDKIGWFDWMEMDIEDHAKAKKKEKEQTVLDSLPKSMRVPGKHAPAFTPMLITGILITLHCLVVLLQHWLVSFYLWLNYTEVSPNSLQLPDDDDDDDDDVELLKDGLEIVKKASERGVVAPHLPTHARVTPSDDDGKDVLVPLLYLPTLGMTFEFHRRRYIYDSDTHVWSKVRCTTNMPTDFFGTWNGLSSDDMVMASQIRFGANIFDVKQPTFTELYKKQLLSPFTVFQLFCVVLWMLDDYWQYSFFTLFMILMFEATVVFSRIKSLSALKGMGNSGNNSHPLLVYRNHSWKTMDASDLLPGDILSLTRKHVGSKTTAAAATPTDNLENIVPADVLLLRGTTVVNEASLTGESVPQMKEGLTELLPDDSLCMKNKHKTHILYAGTKLLQCQGTVNQDADDEELSTKLLYGHIPKPEDGGCLCFVLRTGFSAAQGKLVRMMEGSQEKVKGHERETGLLLLMLFFFALASSSYVLYHGWHNENRSQYELLLHCILIVTSVIPPELPMQMALAVNNSLMTLMKMQVFCTEPFRVPMAGKLDACLFDKTGTLTTDELVAVGVFTSKSDTAHVEDATKMLTPMTKVTDQAALVLAGCHSLIWIDGETTGDPLESASLNAMRWGFNPDKTTKIIAKEATEKKEAGKPIVVDGQRINELEVLARHHFASKLQRMSCVVRDVTNRRTFAVVKGSPEAIAKLLVNTPKNYDVVAKALAKRGFRVISLAYKALDTSQAVEKAKDARVNCENNVSFAGFIAFTCRVRKDTKMVLERLKEGGMTVAMITGDALLTAAHVAQQVAICDSNISNSNTDDDEEEEEEDADIALETNEELKKIWKLKRKQNPQHKPKSIAPKNKIKKSILILEQRNGNNLYWQSYDDETYVADFVAAEVPEVAKKYDLATTGKNLAAALEHDEVTKTVLAHFKIFARMTPDAKETVIECLHSVGALCLMCGDGANDVGALKQADVGVALLSGFGDINVDKGEDGNNKKKVEDEIIIDPKTLPKGLIMNEREMTVLKTFPVFAIHTQLRKIGVEPKKYPEFVSKDELVQLYQIKAKDYAMNKLRQKKILDDKKNKQLGAKSQQKDVMMDKQLRMQKRAQELTEAGESFATMKAMKEFWANEVSENKQKKAVMAKSNTVEGSAATLAAQLDDLEMEEFPMVKLGDASIAAPFTSKMPSIRSCVDIIRQGRCTLVTSIQMYQILALNCLISAYSLSVLYLDGVKYGDVQMTSMGMLMSVSFMSVSRSKPLQKLSPVKPLTSIFHPSLFISLLGQFAIHLGVMYIAVRGAKQHLPLDYEADLDGEFKPGILNSVVFLVSNVQQVTVFVVNLQGAPFMTGLTENRPLLWSLVATFILTFMFASESVPSLNKYFQLVSFPDDAFRDWILMILAFDVVSTFVLDRIMKLIFCPKILFASVAGTTSKDVLGLAKTIGMILGIMYIFLGNDETWDELLREEGRMEDELNNGTNITDAILHAAEACIGAACGTETDEL